MRTVSHLLPLAVPSLLFSVIISHPLVHNIKVHVRTSPELLGSWSTVRRGRHSIRESSFLSQWLHLLPACRRSVAANQIRQHGRQQPVPPCVHISLDVRTQHTHAHTLARIYGTNFPRQQRRTHKRVKYTYHYVYLCI